MPVDRSKKWKIKVKPALLVPRLEALHKISSEVIARTYRSIDEAYDRAAKILDEAGIFGTNRFIYRSYVEQLWKLTQKYKSKTLDIEADASRIKFQAYGCDRDVLFKIALLFGIVVGKYFTLVLGEMPTGIMSSPPTGKKRIVNIYWDPETKEFVFEYEE